VESCRGVVLESPALLSTPRQDNGKIQEDKAGFLATHRGDWRELGDVQHRPVRGADAGSVKRTQGLAGK
jgi:hypothetical protein